MAERHDAAHELIYTSDAYGATGRLHHLAFWVDTREEVLRAADLFPEQPTVVWSEEERRLGQAWRVKTVETFHTYGTPPVSA